MGREVKRQLRKTLSKFREIAIDTNIFVYYLDRKSTFYSRAEELFRQISSKNLSVITSIITLVELLSLRAPKAQLEKLEQELLLIPNLTMVDVNHRIAKETARIRRDYKFRLPDAVHLATAVEARAQTLITNDKRLKVFKEIPIILLTEIK